MYERDDITPEVLRQLLRYDPETGKLFWRHRDVKWFNGVTDRTPQHAANVWNSRYAGVEAFTYVDAHGYMTCAVFNIPFGAHRVAFAVHHGRWPNNKVDHKNGIRTDNCAGNLRDVSDLANARNMAKSKRNKSGVTGVSWHQQRSKWTARIRNEGKYIHIGLFSEFDDAVKARKKAEVTYGYHANHGRNGADAPATALRGQRKEANHGA